MPASLAALLLALFAALPASAAEPASEGWSLWRSLGLSSSKPNMGKQRNLIFARHGLDEKFIFTQCLRDGNLSDCPPDVRERMLGRIQRSLEGLPPGLRTTKIPMVQWIEQASDQRPTGRMDPSFGISLRTSADEPTFDAVLLHEAAHMFDEQNEDTVSAYQKLRLSTRRMSEGTSRFFAHLRKTNPGIESWSEAELDDEAVRMLQELKVPRRGERDFTALMDGYEYWAVSVELYHKHRGDSRALSQYFSKEEAAFLERFYRR